MQNVLCTEGAGALGMALIHHGYATPAALTGGLQLALWVCGLTGLLAAPAAVLLIRRTERPNAVSIPRAPEVAMAMVRE